MKSKNIGYHTRLYSDNTKKVVGGSFGGQIDQETVERLVNAHFTVKIKPSGHGVFVDREGREVSLYFTIDALSTEKGRQAKSQWNKEQQEIERLEEGKQKLVDELLSNYSNDELIKLLQK